MVDSLCLPDVLKPKVLATDEPKVVGPIVLNRVNLWRGPIPTLARLGADALFQLGNIKWERVYNPHLLVLVQRS